MVVIGGMALRFGADQILCVDHTFVNVVVLLHGRSKVIGLDRKAIPTIVVVRYKDFSVIEVKIICVKP